MLDEKHSVPHTLTSFIEIAIENKNVFFRWIESVAEEFSSFFFSNFHSFDLISFGTLWGAEYKPRTVGSSYLNA